MLIRHAILIVILKRIKVDIENRGFNYRDIIDFYHKAGIYFNKRERVYRLWCLSL